MKVVNEVLSTQDKRVIVFTSKLLPWSHTFIRAQVLAMHRWHPILVADRRAAKGLPLDGIDQHVLCPPNAGRGKRLAWLACRFLGVAHAPSVRELRALDASLVHAHFGTLAVDVWPLVKALGLPMLVTLHGYDITIQRQWWEAGKRGWRRRRYPRQLLDLAQQPNVGFIAVSEAIRQRAIDFGIAADKVRVHHIGIDTQQFQPAGLAIGERAKRIVFIGRLVEKKGAQYLIEAFAQVRARSTDAELIIIGDGPLRASLQQQAAQLNVPVDFRGVLNSEQVRAELHLARVFCLPSIIAANGDAEGLPTVVIEALACGVPVVTSAHGADEAVSDAETGFMFAPKDSASLAEHLTAILSDDALAQTLADNARQQALQHFAIERCTEALQDSYEAMTSGGRISASTPPNE